MVRPVSRLRAASLFAVVALACASTGKAPASPPASAAAQAPASLECTYSASNETRTVRVEPTRDPYGVKELDIGGRFAVKFVYVTSPEDAAGLRVYAYELGDGSPVLLHEGKYRVPPSAGLPLLGRSELTGRELVYDHPLGRELAYSCAWIKP
jgi:hypothetical protein